MHKNTILYGANDAQKYIKTSQEGASAPLIRRWLGTLVAIAAVVVVLAGCAEEIGIGTSPARTVIAGTATLASGQISIPVTNPNAGAVSVRVGISPAVAGATYAVDGTAFSDAATTGFTLAADATQTLVISDLTNEITYRVSLTTVGINGVAHNDIVSQSVALLSPDAFTVTATSGTVRTSAPSITVSLSWTSPSNITAVALGALPAGATASSAILNTAAGASNSVTISGLAAETAQAFTVMVTNSVGSTTGTGSITTAALPVVLYEASNAQDGDFGFDYCQTELDGGATDADGVHKTLYDAGYRTAKFFGSTPDYNYIDIATDTDALGAIGTRPLVTAVGSSFTAQDISSGVAMTLGDLTKLTINGGDYAIFNAIQSNTVINAMLLALVTRPDKRFWSFVAGDSLYNSTNNCTNATSNSAAANGIDGLITASMSFLRSSIPNCETVNAVLCIAK